MSGSQDPETAVAVGLEAGLPVLQNRNSAARHDEAAHDGVGVLRVHHPDVEGRREVARDEQVPRARVVREPRDREADVRGVEQVAGAVDVVDRGVVRAAHVVGVGRIVVGHGALRGLPRTADLPARHDLRDGVHLEQAHVAADVDLPEHAGPRVVGPVGLPDAAGLRECRSSRRSASRRAGTRTRNRRPDGRSPRHRGWRSRAGGRPCRTRGPSPPARPVGKEPTTLPACARRRDVRRARRGGPRKPARVGVVHPAERDPLQGRLAIRRRWRRSRVCAGAGGGGGTLSSWITKLAARRARVGQGQRQALRSARGHARATGAAEPRRGKPASSAKSRRVAAFGMTVLLFVDGFVRAGRPPRRTARRSPRRECRGRRPAPDPPGSRTS